MRSVRTGRLRQFEKGQCVSGPLNEVAQFRDLLTALRSAVAQAIAAGTSEDAVATEVALPDYATLPRYREWLAPNLRAVYRYLRP